MYSVSVIFGFVLTLAFLNGPAVGTEICSYTKRDSAFKEFYPLSKIPNSQVDGFLAMVRVAVQSDYGHIHILLSESNDAVNSNRGYEFALSPWEDSEIRRRDFVFGKYEVVAKTGYNVKEYAPNTTNIEVSVSTDGVVKILDVNSNATFNFTDPVPLSVKFISFAAHSKFEFNCDYGVFHDVTPFIQTRCETIFGWREELFHPLTSVSSSRPDGYLTKVDISMLSDYGDIYVLLSETNERDGPNPCYEIVIGDRYKTTSGIRRKTSITESHEFVGETTFAYNIKSRRSSLWFQISVSEDGVVAFTDLNSKLQFNYMDTNATFPINYITFGGYRKYPATYAINCIDAETKC